MKFPYDLHIHSYYSDGDYSPKELIEIAKKNKMQGVVLTDHNTIEGIKKFQLFAKQQKIQTLQGIEISTKYNRTDIHILGYSLKFNSDKLKKNLEQTINGYNERAKKIISILNKNKIANTSFQKIFNKRPSKNCAVAKYHIATEIVKISSLSLKKVQSMVGRGGIAYVPYGDWAMTPFEAIKLIKKSNGIAVMAHPGDFFTRTEKKNNINDLIKLIKNMKKVGLIGLEICYTKHTKKQKKEFSQIAEKFNLIKTGGSDYHGMIHKPNIYMGTSGIDEKEFQKLKFILKK